MNSVELDLKFIETLPFLGGIGFLEFAPNADRKGFFAAIKKFTSKKLVLLTPDTLFEFLKKKTPPAELKKLTFTQPKDIPQDQLLKLILGRVKAAEEEKRAPQPPRSASKMKKPGLENSDSVDPNSLAKTFSDNFSLEEKLNFYLVVDVLKTSDDYRALAEQGTPIDVGFFLAAGPRKDDDPKPLFYDLRTLKAERKDVNLEDTLFIEIDTPKDTSSCIDSIIQKLSETAINKLKYKSWLHRAAFLELPKPSVAFSGQGISGYKEYEAVINRVPYDCCSPTQLLNGILEQVAANVNGDLHTKTENLTVNEISSYFSELKDKLFPTTKPQKIKKPSTEDQTPQSVVLVNERDMLSEAINWWCKTELNNIEDRYLHEADRFLKFFTETRITEEKRQELLMDRNNFYSHSPFSPQQIDQALLGFEFEDMVNDVMEKEHGPSGFEEITFDDRTFSETLSKKAVSMTIRKALQLRPEIVTHYYPFNDSMLLCFFHNVPPEKHTQLQNWKSPISAKTTFTKWLEELSSGADLVQETKKTHSIYDIEEEKILFGNSTCALFPTNGSVVQVSTTTNTSTSTVKEGSVTIFHETDTFAINGTKSASEGWQYYFSSMMGTTSVAVKRDPISKLAKSTVGFPNGLTVSHNFQDGSISQTIGETKTAKLTLNGKAVIEVRRIILSDGTLIRCLADDSREVFFPSGKTLEFRGGVSIITSEDGGRKQVLEGGASSKMNSLGVSVVTQPETKDITVTREDLMVVKKFNCGAVSVHCPEGTVISTSTDGSITITSSDYATVEIRPDGTSVSVSGCSTSLRTDKDTIVIQQSKSSSSRGVSLKITKNAEIYAQNASSHNSRSYLGAYSFDLNSGTFQLSDEGKNVFKVDGSYIPSVSIQNNKLHAVAHSPTLLIVHRDGSGLECLKNSEIVPYFQTKEEERLSGQMVFITEEEVLRQENSSCVTVMTKKSVPDSSKIQHISFRQIVKSTPLSKQQRELLLSQIDEYETLKSKAAKKMPIITTHNDEQHTTTTNMEQNEDSQIQKKLEDYLNLKGKSPQEIHQEIFEKYKQKQISLAQNEKQKQQQQLQEKLNKNEEDKKKASQKKSDSIEFHNIVASAAKSEVLETNYFETEDGLSFLKSYMASKDSGNSNTTTKSRAPPKPRNFDFIKKLNSEEIKKTLDNPPKTPTSSTSLLPVIQSPSRSKQQPTTTTTTTTKQRETLTTPPIHKPNSSTDLNYVNNSGLIGAIFSVSPQSVEMGALKEFSTYKYPLSFTNTGTTTVRFVVKQPKNKHLRVSYIPGPVAPGIVAKLDLEVRTEASGSKIEDEIRIETEFTSVVIPISASVVPALDLSSPSRGARLVAQKKASLTPSESVVDIVPQ